MDIKKALLLLLGLLAAIPAAESLDDLIAEETENVRNSTSTNTTEPAKKYSSKIKAENVFGQKTSPKKTTLDFRIEPEGLQEAAAGGGKGKEDEEEEKTLAQQVADGKYGLIQNELFPDGSKRPGIISYAPNPEVPRDTKDNYGGLDKDEIWLAEDHVLVLRGGAFPQRYNETQPTPWSPIDDYVAPTRQVEIPKNPKIPPPFPVQLTENGPLEFIRGENGSLPPRPPPYPPFPFPSPPGSNNSLYPVPPGQLPPYFPPGAAFLPPPGNLTDFDEDDPSIYYPPKYDFFYPVDNSTQVPPGPLVPGIVLPPPPNFFAPEKPNDEENETDLEDATTRPPYVAPAYLPSERKPYKPRPYSYTKRPPVEKKTTVTYVYPEKVRSKTTKTPPGFTSPIYVPNTRPAYHPLPTTSPRPNHITIPRNQTLKQDIYIISTEPPEVANDILDLIKNSSPTRTTSLDGISPERHPLRSLIRPNVSVSYIGKVGHLPPSTAFPFPQSEPPRTESYQPPSGHYITLPPTVTVTPVPIVKKIRVKPTETATQNPHATFFFYEEPAATPTPSDENEVSGSPIEQFLKDNFKENAPEYELKPVKSPVYIPKHKPVRIRPRPTYVPQEEPPKLNALEIENPGFSGLNSLSPSTESPYTQSPKKNPVVHAVTDGPFIPSNYYATANPASIHYTPIDPNIVDDITMKYFTIFGQKLNAVGGTTPLTPVPPTSVAPTTPRPRPVHAYTTTTESPRVVTIKPPQSHRPTPHSYIQINSPKPRPQSQSYFEQYLKEITGEDQKDYILSHNGVTPKIKKPKSRPGFNDNPNLHQYYLPYRPAEISQYIEHIYRPPQHSTTLRPVSNVEIQPQYLPHISTTLRPYLEKIPHNHPQQPQSQRLPKPLSHNFGQYLQEVTYSGLQRPASGSNLQYFEASAPSPVRQQYQASNQQPVSLAGDILVNYQHPLPATNPDAELIQSPYTSNSNIQVVNAPDLSRKRPPYQQVYQPRKPRPQSPYEPAKAFFENLPHSGYFNAPQHSQGNSFVSYNLPGNGGHFYFLTPQAISRSDNEGEDDELGYQPVKRSGDNDAEDHGRRGREREREPQTQSTRGESVRLSSQDYLRRRKKKP